MILSEGHRQIVAISRNEPRQILLIARRERIDRRVFGSSDRSAFLFRKFKLLAFISSTADHVRSDTQKQPESRNYRNVTRGDEEDDGDEGLRKEKRKEKVREKERQNQVWTKETEERHGRSSCFVWSRPVQCKIQPLILKRFANQPHHCSPVKARDFLGGGKGGEELIVF